MLCHRFDRWVKKFDLITPDLLIVPLDDNSDNLSDNSDGDGYVPPRSKLQSRFTCRPFVVELGSRSNRFCYRSKNVDKIKPT